MAEFKARAAQGSPLHSGPLRGNYLLIANIEQKWEGSGTERTLRARIVEPDLKPGVWGKNPVRTLWPVKVRFQVAPAGGVLLTCGCKLKGLGDKCYHVGVLEALMDSDTLDVYVAGTTHERREKPRGRVEWTPLDGQSTVALTFQAVTVHIIHSGSAGTLVARRKLDNDAEGAEEGAGVIVEGQTRTVRGAGGRLVVRQSVKVKPLGQKRKAGQKQKTAQRGKKQVGQGKETALPTKGKRAAPNVEEWFCEKCTVGQMDLHGRCIHSYQLAGLKKAEWQPQGEGVRVPETPEEVWGLDFGVKPYPQLGMGTTLVCSACPRGVDKETAKVTQAQQCLHLATLSSTPELTPQTAADLRNNPVILGKHVRVAHVCTTECEFRPCGQLPPRDANLNQTAEQATSLVDTRRWSLEGRFCQDRPVTPAPCGAPWRLEWSGEGRLIKANAVHSINIGTWWCAHRCKRKCSLRYDAAKDGLYFLTPQTLITQEMLKSMEHDLLKVTASFQQIVSGWEGKAERTFVGE